MAVRNMRIFFRKVCKFMFPKMTNIITFRGRNKISMDFKCVHPISRAHKLLKKCFASLHCLGDRMGFKKSGVSMTKTVHETYFQLHFFQELESALEKTAVAILGINIQMSQKYAVAYKENLKLKIFKNTSRILLTAMFTAL